MKWMYNIKEKGKFILLLCVLLIIEIFSNSSQTENVQQLDSTINEIYSDRLMAQDLLFKMAESIHQQKTILLAKYNQDSINVVLDQSFEKIIGFINSYDKTALTKEEAILYAQFKKKIERLNSLALNFKEDQLLYKVKDEYMVELDSISLYLNNLAKIQVSRSGDLNKDAHQIVSSSNIINELNRALMIITALGITAIALASKSIVSEFYQQERLN